MLLLFLWKNSVLASNFSFFLFFPVWRATAERKRREVMTAFVLPSFDWFTPDQTNKQVSSQKCFYYFWGKIQHLLPTSAFFPSFLCWEQQQREREERSWPPLSCLHLIGWPLSSTPKTGANFKATCGNTTKLLLQQESLCAICLQKQCLRFSGPLESQNTWMGQTASI